MSGELVSFDRQCRSRAKERFNHIDGIPHLYDEVQPIRCGKASPFQRTLMTTLPNLLVW